jgi:hypothetical protein
VGDIRFRVGLRKKQKTKKQQKTTKNPPKTNKTNTHQHHPITATTAAHPIMYFRRPAVNSSWQPGVVESVEYTSGTDIPG